GTRRAHQHGEGGAVDPHLHRLLDGHAVPGGAMVGSHPNGPHVARAGHGRQYGTRGRQARVPAIHDTMIEMAATFSFDVSSTIDMQELDNAVNQARKEL